MRVVCLRHGATEGNVTGRFNGPDDPLTAPEREYLSATRFDAAPYDAIYCSPYRRAVETAQCLKLPRWTPEPRLVERRFGIFEGLTAAECTARYPEEFARFRAFDADYAAPNGESRAQNFARVADWVRDAAVAPRVLAITHGGTIDFLYRLAVGIALHGGDRIYSGDNATLAIFDIDWPNVRLVDFDAPLDVG
ncbi:MAG TPA: histidine phosphatase family protein [Pseudomonadales bacterium]|nr:histidine phosphatase family protein [Pseudomonadales bacterium]